MRATCVLLIGSMVLALAWVPSQVRAQGTSDTETRLVQAGLRSQPTLSLQQEEQMPREEVLGIIRMHLEPAHHTTFDQFIASGLGGHFATAMQRGGGHDAQLYQFGASNIAVTGQYGNGLQGNRTNVIQIGWNNVLGAWLTGEANRMDVFQTGSDNVYLMEFAGTGSRLPPVVQSGHSNQVIQMGAQGVSFGVRQYGDNMRLVIQHLAGPY